jgi:hypothetical protein
MRRNREKEISSLRSFVDGAFFATITFLVLFLVIDWKIKNETWISVFGSFVVAGFTIAAAWVALRGNRVQIAQNSDLEDERRQNSLIAAKAVLPSILSELTGIATNNLLLIFPDNVPPRGNDTPPATEFQRIPETLLPPLKECIQHADSVSQERLANILRHFQVYDARRGNRTRGTLRPSLLDNPPPPSANELTAISNAIGWAVIHALLSDAYSFARGSKLPIPPTVTADRVRGAFLSAGIILDNYPHLETALENRIARARLEQNWRDE